MSGNDEAGPAEGAKLPEAVPGAEPTRAVPGAEPTEDFIPRNATTTGELRELERLQQHAVTPLRIIQWLLCPALFIGGCWWAAAAPQQFAAALPKPRYSWLLGGPAATGAQTLLHKLPKSMSAAWQLGRLASHVEASQGSQGGAAAAGGALQEAAAILRVPAQQLSPDDLLQLGGRLTEFEARRGMASRLAGALSFVNLMWAAAIVGLTISVGPVIAIVCQPAVAFVVRLLERAAAVAVRVATAAEPLWEALAYGCCLYIIGAAQRYPADSAGLIAATGCALALPAFFYSTRRHLGGASGDASTFSAVLNAYLCLVLAPTAVTHQSGLLGFGAAAALYSAVGFSILPTGLCWYIGFDGKDSMVRAAATAAVLLSALIGMRAGNVDTRYIDPFRLGLSCLGGITLFLAGLIRCSLYYDQWGSSRDSEPEARAAYRRWLATNGGYLALLAASAGAGSIYRMPAISNTAATFFALWVGEKSAEFLKGRLIWLGIFGGSITLWQAALFLRSRPDFLATMLAW